MHQVQGSPRRTKNGTSSGSATRKYSIQETIQVYMDWANHYLDKSNSKKHIQDLQHDVTDGVLLADVIEAATNQKIAGVNRKPKTALQMVDNIRCSLSLLAGLGVNVEGIQAKDVRDGNLKTILGLFYALSRYKQQQKQHLLEDNRPRDSGIPTPSRKAASSRSVSPLSSFIPTPQSSPYAETRSSMLEKLKGTTSASKRTSSSSGFSDGSSSTSLHQPPTPNGEKPCVQKPSRIRAVTSTKRNSPKTVRKTSSIPTSPTASPGPGVTARSSSIPKPFSNQPREGDALPVRTQDTRRLSQESPVHKANQDSSVHKPSQESPIHKPSQESPIHKQTQESPIHKQTQDFPSPVHKQTQESPIHKQTQESPIHKQTEESPIHKPNESTITPSEEPSLAEGPVKVSAETIGMKVLSSDKPTAAVKGTVVTMGQRTVALVSPMPSIENNMSESSHSNSTGQSNSSDGSVIHQPSGSDDLKEEDNNVQPMEPLLGRGYNRTLMSGYMSDGGRGCLTPDICDGYISEGGASLYARTRLHAHHIINSFQCDPSAGQPGNKENLVKVSRISEPRPPSRGGLGLQSKRPQQQPQQPQKSPKPVVEQQPQVVYRVVSSRVKKSDSSQQTEGPSQSSQWKKYTDVGRVPELHHDSSRQVHMPGQLQRGKSDLEVVRGSKSRASEKPQRKFDGSGNKVASSKVRGVPQSFGYVKRSSPGGGSGGKGETRTAQVSAVPRTKVKVSGGTQTCPDLQNHYKSYSLNGPDLQNHYKSYSLTGPTASQLSQSVRERLLLGSQSLPQPSRERERDRGFQGSRERLMLGSQSLPKPGSSEYQALFLRNDGSLSDTTYGEMHSRASLTHARLMLRDQRENSPRMNRSNSIRSTKSEKFYPTMMEHEPYYCLPLNHGSQPTSPTPSLNYSSFNAYSKTTSLCKDDEVHGSSVSLVSTASSLYSTPEEKQAHEIRKLRRELLDAQEKVQTLTSQLSTNAHVVAAFEQSLSNMTQRLQQLTSSSERKDTELCELRQTMELLRGQEGQLSRQISADSVSSLNSLSSSCSQSSSSVKKKKKKKGWLRSSFSRAFSRSKKNKNGSVSDGHHSDVSAPSSPLLNCHAALNGQLITSQSSSALYGGVTPAGGTDQVAELRRQLREKDLVLTDIRLEALSSAHQLESLKDTVLKMRSEMMQLKQQQDLHEPSDEVDLAPVSTPDNETHHRVLVHAMLGCHQADCVIGAVYIEHDTTWEQLDSGLRRTFKEYVSQVDPATNLGLTCDSMLSYHVTQTDITRLYHSTCVKMQQEVSDVLNRDTNSYLRVCLRDAMHDGSVDALAFDTLIPKAIVQRYVALLSDHRRIILCGPSGTGKSYLANKLAEFLVTRDGKDCTPEAVATFNVDHKSSKELRQYLANLAEQCENNASDLPSVIILDNLHHAASLGEVFNGFLNAKYSKCPYIIGTMNQATCSTTNLQLHHNFRWVLCANHMEPVKGFLGRYLTRRLLEIQARSNARNADLVRIMEWIPNVWQHLNKFLETHSSSDVTIGPRLFLSCPSDSAGSQVWFTDLWNYSVVPYLMEAVREGLQLYGRRATWEDPTLFICQTYPWPASLVLPHGGAGALLRLRPEDVGYNVQHNPGLGSGSVRSMSSAQSDNEGDPLLNMLMRLQEAANYSSPQSNDSDSTSVDSHSSSHLDPTSTRLESTL